VSKEIEKIIFYSVVGSILLHGDGMWPSTETFMSEIKMVEICYLNIFLIRCVRDILGCCQ
jgi:hypothetical protein